MYSDSPGMLWEQHSVSCLTCMAMTSDAAYAARGRGWPCQFTSISTNAEAADPQATDKKAEQTACASSRSAATTYPVQVRWGSPNEHLSVVASPDFIRPADVAV